MNARRRRFGGGPQRAGGLARGRERRASAGRRGGGGLVLGGGEAELGADLGEAGLGLGVLRGLLDLEHAALDRLALRARPCPSPWRSAASILSRTSSMVGTSSPTVSDSDAIALFICSCIFACSSCVRSFWRSASLLLEELAVLGDRRLGLIGGLRGLQRHRLEVLDLLLELDEPVGERLGGRVYSVAFAVSPFFVASSAISTAWRALRVDLLELLSWPG